MRRGVSAIAALAAALTVCDVARADELEAHLEKAKRLVTAERYRDALVEIEAARAVAEPPRLLYERARIRQKLGEWRLALVDYDAYLALDAGEDPALRADAWRQITELRELRELDAKRPKRRAPVRAGALVDFRPEDNDERYHVAVAHRGCTAPCSIELQPGPYKVSISGGASFTFVLHVPPAGGTVRVQHPMSAMLVSGIVLMSASAVMMIGGNLGGLAGSLGGSPAAFPLMITFGWTLGPALHLTGIGLMGGALAKVSSANVVEPREVPVSSSPSSRPEPRAIGMTFAF